VKPVNARLAIVTATLGEDSPCVQSWSRLAAYEIPIYTVRDHMGVVPAFAEGVRFAFEEGAEAVMAIHDDVEILQPDWDLVVMEALSQGVKFAGFGGATSLGSADLYHTPYDPMQLARGGFVSNMRDAEAHGMRSRVPVQCVCFDGFCNIGTREWFKAAWEWLAHSGITHHLYDSLLGCLAARAGVQPGLMLPVACHHHGGRTAVGNVMYQAWAKEQDRDGDQGFWETAHRIGYNEFKDVLPMEVRNFVLPGLRR
jgi:hypothetical protein